MLRLLLLWLPAVLVLACMAPGSTRTPSPEPMPPASVAGRTFLSTEVSQGGQPRPLVEDTRVRLTFREQELTAQAGCNTILADYEVVDGQLLVGQVGMTEMGCPGELHEQDNWLAAFLSARPLLVLAGDTLTLSTEEVQMSLLDREVAEPDRPLVGPTWRLHTILHGDTASSVPAGIEAIVVFGADDRAAVNTGCNVGGGQVSPGEGTLAFGPIGLTRRACLDGAGEVERLMLELFSAAEVGYSIEAGNLTLQAGELGLVFGAD